MLKSQVLLSIYHMVTSAILIIFHNLLSCFFGTKSLKHTFTREEKFAIALHSQYGTESYDCSNANEVILKDMSKQITSIAKNRLHNHNKIQHNQHMRILYETC